MGWYEESDLQRARAEAWAQGAEAAWQQSGEGWNYEYGPSEPPVENPFSNERDGEKRYGVPCCAPWKTCTTDIERIGDAWFRISNGDRYNLPVED